MWLTPSGSTENELIEQNKAYTIHEGDTLYLIAGSFPFVLRSVDGGGSGKPASNGSKKRATPDDDEVDEGDQPLTKKSKKNTNNNNSSTG